MQRALKRGSRRWRRRRSSRQSVYKIEI